ncbi:MAG: TIGR03087 family PEP-CTERM/XrtA system glycosyltransferase [Ectothiorhodospira sp.]
MKPALLLLVHRIPYPPNKGDKIRSFNLLKHLAEHYAIHLGCFVDDPDDWRHLEVLQGFCARTCVLPLPPLRSRLKGLRGLLTGDPLTVSCYASPPMRRWVRATLRDVSPRRILVFSTAMAQYLPPEDRPGCRTVVDFVDVDSDKWRQYAAAHRFPMNRLYAREARILLAFERAVAARADAAVFVSDAEAALFRERVPEVAGRIEAVDNGVDVDYFSPERTAPDPFGPGEGHLVFTGAMDYRANVDAVCWFAREVFPRVRDGDPAARFTIVGARPTAEVRRLGQQPGIRVTGAVKDVRPYLAHAHAAVAPLRLARGVQNKVLEAMAMARPVIATPQAMDGLRLCDGAGRLVAGDPPALARMALDALGNRLPEDTGTLNRECVCRHYNWSEHMGRFVDLLETTDPASPG